jgi:hypothetical protein
LHKVTREHAARGLAQRPQLRTSIFLRWWSFDRIADIAVLCIAVGLGFILARIQVGSGDYGQWLMVSRYYLGQDFPDYRNISAVPPVMPLLLAFTRFVIPDPMVALQVFKGVLAVALVLAFYLAGTAIFRQRAAGLLSAVFAFLVTDKLLELFAFGGLPQLSALVFMALGIAAFAHASSYRGLHMRWWLLGSLCIALAGLSHVGTGMMAVVAGGAVAFASTLRNRELTWYERSLALVPMALVLAALAAYWGTELLPANRQYIENPASLAYRGPGLIWERLRSYFPTLVLLGVGAGFLIGGSLYEASSRRIGGFLVTGGWAMSAWGALSLSIMSGAATDYPRFITPILAPLAVAAGGGLALTFRRSADLLLEPLQQGGRMVLPLALAGAIALGFGPWTVERHGREARWYALPELADVVIVAHWLESRLPEEQAVLTTTNEGKWIEGLTGREALFNIPVRFSFREVERARGVAAEALLRSTTTMTNEFFLIKYVDRKSGSAEDVPRQPWVAINHGGEYVDLVRILPTTTRVLAADGKGGVLATLNALDAMRVEGTELADQVTLQTFWTGERRGGTLSYTRSLSLSRGSTSLELVDEVTSTIPIQEIQVEVKPVSGLKPTAIDVESNQADFYFPQKGSSQPHIRLTASSHQVVMEPLEDGGGVLVRAPNATRLHLRFSAPAPGLPIFESRLLLPKQLIDKYNVGAVVLKRGPALEARMNRLSVLGFNPELEVGPYVVLVRETP